MTLRMIVFLLMTDMLTSFTHLFFRSLSKSFVLFFYKDKDIITCSSSQIFSFYCSLHICSYLFQCEISQVHEFYNTKIQTISTYIEFIKNHASTNNKHQCSAILLHLFSHYPSNLSIAY
jgi:hypothetical protein